MRYVALLRGINVGGKSKVEMARLKKVCEDLGFNDVLTYINSGNVIFTTTGTKESLTKKIEQAIEHEFHIPVKVTLRTLKDIQTLDDMVPTSWVNNESMKTDIMFLWKPFDSKKVLDMVTIKPDIDEVVYTKGTLIWRVDRKHITKSGLLKIIGTELYKHMTVRNVNTLRKLRALMEQ
jgi:uncharacterized protein (DUF1697 family)